MSRARVPTPALVAALSAALTATGNCQSSAVGVNIRVPIPVLSDLFGSSACEIVPSPTPSDSLWLGRTPGETPHEERYAVDR